MKLSNFQPPVPNLRLFSRAAVRVASPQVLGTTRFGERRVAPIIGGADWLTWKRDIRFGRLKGFLY